MSRNPTLFSTAPGLGGGQGTWWPRLGVWSGLAVYVGQWTLTLSLWRAQPGALEAGMGQWGALAFALYGLAYAAAGVPRLPDRGRVLAVAVMSVTLVAFNWVFAHLTSFTSVSMQVITALAITLAVPIRPAVVWIVVQACALAWANAYGLPAAYAALLYPTYIIMSLFAAYMMRVVLREREQRATLTELNRELQAARDAVEASARETERHRIARDLHDTLGHRLTALGLELQFAQQVDGDEREWAMERAQQINSQLLSEVRQTIRDVREDPAEPLERTFRALGQGFPVALEVHCEPLDLAQRTRDILLKCAREAVTNAVRHADAQQIELSLRRGGHFDVLRVENDGQAPAGPLRYGEGLRGMQDRLASVGGELHIGQRAGRFVLEARVPWSA